MKFRTLLLLGLLTCLKEVAAQAPATGLTIEYVAGHRELWPRQVITKAPVQVTLKVNGVPKAVTVPAGELMDVVSVEGSNAHLKYQGADVAMPAAQTDLLAGAAAAQVRLLRGSAPAAAPRNAPPSPNAAPPAPNQPPGENPVIKFLGDSLVAFRGDSIVPQASSQLAGKRFIALYFASRANPECSAFTDKLKNFYREHRVDSRKFEIVLVPTDRSAGETAYQLREKEMPWLAVDFSRQEIVRGLRQQFGGADGPVLVVLDDAGRVMVGNAAGADKAMEVFGQILDRS